MSTTTTREIVCAHCGQLVPPTFYDTFTTSQTVAPDPDSAPQFCCSGCATVYEILHGCDLEEYYRLRGELSISSPQPAKVTGKNFAGFDDPAFLATTSKALAGGLLEVELFVEGTHCIACAWLIEKILMEREGVPNARLDIGRRVVQITFDPVKTPLSQLARSLDRIGYPPHPLTDSASTSLRDTDRQLLVRMGVAAAGAGNIMLYTMGLYVGEFTGIETEFSALFKWISLGLALPVVTYSAFPFYRGAWLSIKHRVPAMDLPVALGIIIGFVASVYATMAALPHVYFDTVASLVFLLLVGRYVLARANRWASESSASFLTNMPKLVTQVTPDGLVEKPLSDIQTGDLLRVLPGETIPVDGLLMHASATVSEAALTGESRPQHKSPGDRLFAGNTVIERPLELQATAIGEATRLGKLALMMQQARLEKAPLMMITDRISGWFVGGTLALAVATFSIWWLIDPTKAVWHTVAMMVVACPCALGLAVPIAFAVSIGFAARKGAFIRGASVIERLAKVKRVVLDKTGTITRGEPHIREWYWFHDSLPLSESTIRSAANSIENFSNHHLARAFRTSSSTPLPVRNVRQVAGSGISGEVQLPDESWHTIVIGTREFTLSAGAFAQSDSLQHFLSDSGKRGDTLVWSSWDGAPLFIASIGDALLEDAKLAVGTLREMGIEVELLSGDDLAPVAAAATDTGMTQYRDRVSPEEKLVQVRQRMENGQIVAMAGDGINDAAALAAADVGISPAGSAEVAREAAGVFLAEPGVMHIVSLITLSKQTMSRIRWNLAIAVAYNVFGALAASLGYVTPLVAAILMPVSSLTALYLATRRSLKWK